MDTTTVFQLQLPDPSCVAYNTDSCHQSVCVVNMLGFVQDYGCLGHLQQRHLASMPHMFEFTALIVDSVHTYSGSQQFLEMQSPLLLLAMLFRS